MNLLRGLLAGFLGLMVFAPHAFSADAAGTSAPHRIVFLGDSITQAGAGPGGYVTLVRETLEKHHPDQPIEIIGAGISGNRVPDLEKRLERDVLDKKPTLVVIYIGINDVWHSLQGRGTPAEEFEKGLRGIIQRIQDAKAKVILCTPSVIGEKTDGSNQLDAMLDEYSAISRRVASDTDALLLDLRKKFLARLQETNPNNSAEGILTTDGVHLNAAGNQFVAEKMMEALERAIEHPLLRHVVLFKFKDELTDAQVDEVVKAFAALPGQIPAIVDFEYGTDVSVENRAEGFTHGFVVTFRSIEGRDEYLPHPAHKKFVELAGPRIEKVLVFDYWTKRD